jgi:hypothetical protein
MVDYHNPVTIAREFSAYVYLSGVRTFSPIDRSAFSTAGIVNFWHIVDGIFMYVSLPGPYSFSLQHLRDYSTTALRC